MGRKTFCTLGSGFFNFSEEELKKTTHHKTNQNFIKYLDPGYVNVPQEVFASKVFQRYEQGNWKPPLSGNTSLQLQLLTTMVQNLSSVVRSVCVPLLRQRQQFLE